ncbi:Eco57I restriction-modification methylase domain-containing protein [Rothia nasimurium]|uniref:Eco57I restriction-modification methylase domain-containing protein n=1 Tax=Rothia nasimurium TaxID=85336 RepID=UPI001F029625|nr:Eco57I restriction-modification methylase domain-containing protein [Rothia nasimurium]
MNTLLQRTENVRTSTLQRIGLENLSEFEQFFTPIAVAEIMADLVDVSPLAEKKEIRILDPGAGIGVLAIAAGQRIREALPQMPIHVVAIEKDPSLLATLEAALADAEAHLGDFTYTVQQQDFVYWAYQDLMSSGDPQEQDFDVVIMNPPYAKIAASSAEAKHLRVHDVNVPNLYAAFVALGAQMLSPDGQLIAITPRSWMNGPYFQQYRELLHRTCSLTHIHTFKSRKEVFKDTGVLQESVITKFENKLPTEHVLISSSVAQGQETKTRTVAREAVESQGVIFVPAHQEDEEIIAWMARATHHLSDIGLQVSTGKVVDFRNKDKLQLKPNKLTVPLVYPAHFTAGNLQHPKADLKKPQYYQTTTEDKNTVAPGIFVLVKRFSAKEEKRRVTAAIWSSKEKAAFDNKTNYFHSQGEGLSQDLALGLTLWLNSSYVDRYFRIFSGHTQVNATDLRMMPYPSTQQLRDIARTGLDPDAAVYEVLGNKDKVHAAA